MQGHALQPLCPRFTNQTQWRNSSDQLFRVDMLGFRHAHIPYQSVSWLEKMILGYYRAEHDQSKLRDFGSHVDDSRDNRGWWKRCSIRPKSPPLLMRKTERMDMKAWMWVIVHLHRFFPTFLFLFSSSHDLRRFFLSFFTFCWHQIHFLSYLLPFPLPLLLYDARLAFSF